MVSEQISVDSPYALKVKFHVPISSGEFLPQNACVCIINAKRLLRFL